jgi:hypothetical protein
LWEKRRDETKSILTKVALELKAFCGGGEIGTEPGAVG